MDAALDRKQRLKPALCDPRCKCYRVRQTPVGEAVPLAIGGQGIESIGNPSKSLPPQMIKGSGQWAHLKGPQIIVGNTYSLPKVAALMTQAQSHIIRKRGEKVSRAGAILSQTPSVSSSHCYPCEGEWWQCLDMSWQRYSSLFLRRMPVKMCHFTRIAMPTLNLSFMAKKNFFVSVWWAVSYTGVAANDVPRLNIYLKLLYN